MGRAFLKVYFDFDEMTEELSDTERARLLLAMYYYAKTGEKKALSGNERFLFGVFKGIIDRDVADYNAKVDNGNKGGRPSTNQSKTENNLTETEKNLNETEKNLNKPNETEIAKTKTKTKDLRLKTKTIEANASCAEASSAPVATLPLVDGSEYMITEAEYTKDREAFPAVDVLQEYRQMGRWLDSNPKNRKTRNGIRRFVNAWLSREQDRARPQTKQPRMLRAQDYEQREYNEAEMAEKLGVNDLFRESAS